MKPKLATAAVLGGVAMIFSFLDSAGQALSDNAPALAHKFDPHNEIANQRLINLWLKQVDDKAVLARAARLTQDTARTAPGLAPILRNFALLVDAGQLKGDTPTLMAMAAQFSKRDVPTQLWLIEQAAASGDINATLAYYDNAMQTNPEVRALLYPILGRAVADPELIGPIANLLKTNPAWATGFYKSFATDAQAMANFPALMTAMGDDATTAIPTSARTMVSSALMESGDVGAAEKVALFGMDASNLTDFSNGQGRALPPFGWELVRSGTVSANVADDNSLAIEVGRGAGGIAARRVVRTAGGTVRVTGRMNADGNAVEQLPRLNLTCVGAKRESFVVIPRAVGQGVYAFDTTLTMPSCRYAELSIRAPGNFADAPISARITALGLQ